ncbi:MAG: hypothetical protein F4Z00_02565 [Acidimicrobiaceae bacterium]|nr:hypothetical protein [Acidimicrobiaceae bacterium]MXZ64414.1 hypothetical protein [Acidimicrobiaceae bacterium]MYF34982.1 hypothetical protein [Acidimicrobiaceae bacterium]MYG79402.1 hypothetical protein [Acidimicrobiaceae bacterium]MYJ83513.1 hypothetical protein [Acidimicrobiaceae bacterium]
MKVAVLGSGAGALAVAADMSRHGRRTVMAGLDDEQKELDPVAERGGVLVADGGRTATHPVDVAGSTTEALAGAELAVVVAPCDDRKRWARAISPHATPDHTVLLVGVGGGAIVARRYIEPPTVVAETNTLPHRARATGPATVDVTAKRGGVLVASLPAIPPDTARVMELIGDVWPQAAATDTVWTTVLTSYDALEAAAAGAAGAADTDAVEAADAELRALRQALFSRESRGYDEFRTAQGLTQTAAEALTPADAAEDVAGAGDVPGALMLASSLGRTAGVPTPAINALVSGAEARLGRDLTAPAPTLAALGLGGLDVTGLIGFARSGLFP